MTKKTIISCLLITQSILGNPVWAHAADNKYLNGLAAKTYFSDLYPGIDKNKFSALCQFWVNKVESEYGFKLQSFLSYTLHSETLHQAIFRFDKLQLSCSYSIYPSYQGGEEHNTSVQLSFSKKEDAEQFYNSKLYSALKKKKTKAEFIGGITVNVENYPYENENSFKDIYSGKTNDFSFNVRLAFDSVAQIALREPMNGENVISVYRDKANRFFLGEGVVKNFEIARDFYQKAWLLGDDTSGLFLGFLFLEYGLPEKNKLYNPALGRAYFDSVCQSGSPIGNYGIGWMYQIGYNGFPKDIVKAISFYEKGAAKGDLCCISALNYVYNNEYGYINRQKAKEYFEQMMYLNPGSKRTKCRPGIF